MLLNKKKTSEIYGLRSKLRLKWGRLKREKNRVGKKLAVVN